MLVLALLLSAIGSFVLLRSTSAGAALPPDALALKPVITSALSRLPQLPTLTERLNILVMGIDYNGPDCERYVGSRSDTMIMASIDPISKKVGVVSIPRDTRVTLARGHGVSKINNAYAQGGPSLAVETVSTTFGVPIDRYIVVDTKGLKDLCQLMGPVEITVEKEMHYVDHTAKLNIDLKPGKQTLDACQLEQYLRFRHDARADLGRMERQQWFLRQACTKLKDPQFLLKVPELIKIGYDNVKTDLTPEEIAKLVSFMKDFRSEQIVTASLPGDGAFIEGISYWLLDERGANATMEHLFGKQVIDTLAETAPDTRGDDRPTRVSISYPKGAEEAAKSLKEELKAAGYNVRYSWQIQEEDCRHPQIILQSKRANETLANQLRTDAPETITWPTILRLERRSGVDINLVVSSDMITPPTDAQATDTKEVLDPKAQASTSKEASGTRAALTIQ